MIMNLTTNFTMAKRKSFFRNFRSFDWFSLSAGIGALIYYLCTTPYLVLFGGLFLGILYPFLGIPFVTQQGMVAKSVTFSFPRSNWKVTLKFWHILAIALTILMLLLMADSSQAFFLNTAQAKLETTICDATVGTGGGTCTASDLVETIFNVIRLAVVLAVIGGIVAIVVQGQQQQDVRPAVMFVGTVFAAVLITEAMSKWILS